MVCFGTLLMPIHSFMRLFTTDDLFTVANYNLDKWTNTVGGARGNEA